MAVTTEAIPAQELTYRAADKPLVVGRHAIEVAHAAGSVRANTAGTVAAADASDATFGVKFLQDRFLHVPWKFGSSVTDLYIVIDTGIADGSGLIDALFIQGAASWAGRPITVEADSTTPAVPWTGATTVFSFVMPVGGTTLKLHATTRYAARYWRIRINGAAGTFQANEILLGRAVQFQAKANYDVDPPEATTGNVIEHRSQKGGVRYGYRSAPSLQERLLEFTVNGRPTSTTPTAFLPDFKKFWQDSDQIHGGSKPFVYCEDPTSAPDAALLVYPNDTKLNLRVVGPMETTLVLDFTEQGGGT